MGVAKKWVLDTKKPKMVSSQLHDFWFIILTNGSPIFIDSWQSWNNCILFYAQTGTKIGPAAFRIQ